jgi:nuclear GTP-binding protein
MKRIYLIDCPGVVHPSPNDTETDIILKGVVRVENLQQAQDHIEEVLSRIKSDYIKMTYGIESWEDHVDFLEQLARKSGRLNKGGEPDIDSVGKMVLNDWIRGKIPFFTMPPMPDRSTPEDELADPAVHENTQPISQIPVMQNFLAEDMKPSEEAVSPVNDSEEETKPENEEEETADWDEVFGGSDAEEKAQEPIPEATAEESEVDSELELSGEEDDEEEEAQSSSLGQKRKAKGLPKFNVQDLDEEATRKNKRMTTNKQKVGFNYYNLVNVKNKNRNKKKVVDPSQLAKRLQRATNRK